MFLGRALLGLSWRVDKITLEIPIILKDQDQGPPIFLILPTAHYASCTSKLLFTNAFTVPAREIWDGQLGERTGLPKIPFIT